MVVQTQVTVQFLDQISPLIHNFNKNSNQIQGINHELKHWVLSTLGPIIASYFHAFSKNEAARVSEQNCNFRALTQKIHYKRN